MGKREWQHSSRTITALLLCWVCPPGRNTKTRIGAESKNNRPVTPKMFSNDNDYCPVKILKTYISHRPVDIHDDPNASCRPLNQKHTIAKPHSIQ
jgi:hypothetical protein